MSSRGSSATSGRERSHAGRWPARVLVPLDGSVVSDAALRIGFAIADRAGLPVTLVHALDGTDRVDAERHLHHVRQRFAAVADCDAVVMPGRAADVILDHADAFDALVCMASHGRGGLARIALGSVAEEVVRRNPRATVVVGPRCTSFAVERERASMLFCTDGSERSAAACPHATRIAELLGVTTTVVQQVEPDEDVALDERIPPRPVLDAARANCAELQRHFETEGITVGAQVVFGETTRAIVDLATSSGATLIALASHGRTGFDRITLGSTAAALVRLAPCPLFVVGPAAVDVQPAPG